MGCFQGGGALGNHGKLKMSEKKKGIFLNGSLSFLETVSHAPVALPPPRCHRGFIAVLMEACSTASCSIDITKGFTWPSANPTRLWNEDRELVHKTSDSLSCTGLFPAGSEVCFEELSVCRLKLVLPLLPKNCVLRDKQNKWWGGEFLEILKLCYPEQVSCLQLSFHIGESITLVGSRWLNCSWTLADLDKRWGKERWKPARGSLAQ